MNLATTGQNYPMLAGNLTSILVSGFVVLVTGLIAPQNYDWKSSMAITMVEQEETGAPSPPLRCCTIFFVSGDADCVSSSLLQKCISWRPQVKTGGLHCLAATERQLSRCFGS